MHAEADHFLLLVDAFIAQYTGQHSLSSSFHTNLSTPNPASQYSEYDFIPIIGIDQSSSDASLSTLFPPSRASQLFSTLRALATAHPTEHRLPFACLAFLLDAAASPTSVALNTAPTASPVKSNDGDDDAVDWAALLADGEFDWRRQAAPRGHDSSDEEDERESAEESRTSRLSIGLSLPERVSSPVASSAHSAHDLSSERSPYALPCEFYLSVLP